MALTGKRIAFCQKYDECGNASEAYRFAYPKSLKWKANVVTQRAYELLKNSDVQVMLEEMKGERAKEHEITVESVAKEYAEIITAALEVGQFAPAVSALTKKAELYGLFKEHQNQGKSDNVVNILPSDVKL